jgi:hypothetical protein
MLGAAPIPNASDRKRRLFAVACCRLCRQLMRNPSHRADVDLAERFADGQATEAELTAAYHRVNDLACARYANTTEREIRRWAEMVAVANTLRLPADASDAVWNLTRASQRGIERQMVALLHDVVGNPFHDINPAWITPAILPLLIHNQELANSRFLDEWRTSDAQAVARGMYEARDFSAMPILADALQDAGCDNDAVLNHCRDPEQVHVRGCWVVDLVLGKS